MSDKEREIAGFLVSALKSGYKITIERNDIGVESHGVHMHVGFVDEVVKKYPHGKLWDYINEKLEKGDANGD